jgi:predicted SAM-dependent methyltransferase
VADIIDLSMFSDESVNEVSCYHVVEHLGHRNISRFFQEIYRVLSPKGKFILETPNLNTVIMKFASLQFNSGEIKGDYGSNSAYETLYGGQEDKGSYHLACFNRYQLMCLLKNVGFEELKIVPELPRRGVEYGPEWNIRLICEK